MSVLKRAAIIAEREAGRIRIEPFHESMVSVNSVDVRLAREMKKLVGTPAQHPSFPSIVDPYRDSSGQFIGIDPLPLWELRNMVGDQLLCRGLDGHGHDGWILEPGHYLGATIEEVGSMPGSWLVPDIDSKSTTVRWGVTTALCAGRGDEGYRGRWTLELRIEQMTVLLVGTVIAQVRFTRAEDFVADGDTYHEGEHSYQPGVDTVDYELRQLPKRMPVLR